MAITTIDGIIAGMQTPEDFVKTFGTMEAAGIHVSSFYLAGRPGAAAVPTPGMSGAALTYYGGQIPFRNPGSGNSYLARLQFSSSQIGCLLLCDRLWHNSGISVTTTTAQTVGSVEYPARDRDGTTNGENVLVAIEVSTATTNASAIANTTMSYTNQAGTSGKTATIPSFPATAATGSFIPFLLAAGDTGVRSIQSITLGTSYVTGVVHLVAFRVLARLEQTIINTGNSIDAVTAGFPRLYDNTVPWLVWLASGTTGPTIVGHMIVTQG
jgi:hypothetical protein